MFDIEHVNRATVVKKPKTEEEATIESIKGITRECLIAKTCEDPFSNWDSMYYGMSSEEQLKLLKEMFKNKENK